MFPITAVGCVNSITPSAPLSSTAFATAAPSPAATRTFASGARTSIVVTTVFPYETAVSSRRCPILPYPTSAIFIFMLLYTKNQLRNTSFMGASFRMQSASSVEECSVQNLHHAVCIAVVNDETDVHFVCALAYHLNVDALFRERRKCCSKNVA